MPASPTEPDPVGSSLNIDTGTSYQSLPLTGAISVNGEETVIVRLTLSSTPTLSHDRVEDIIYSTDTLTPFTLTGSIYHATSTVALPTFPSALSSVTLKLGLARNGGFGTNPTVKVNGTALSGVYVSDSNGVADYHGVTSVSVPVGLVTLGGNNTILVETTDSSLATGNPFLVSTKLQVTYYESLNTH